MEIRTTFNRAVLVLAGLLPVAMGCAPIAESEGESSLDEASLGTTHQGLQICDGRVTIDEFKELMIVDQTVVQSSAARNDTGATGGPLSFNRLMTRLAGSTNAAVFTENFLRTWTVDHTLGQSLVPARNFGGIQRLLADNNLWPRLANNTLDMQRAPFRLLAVVNRPDLAGPGKPNGEGRLVFGLVDGTFGASMTLIFEFNLPTAGGQTVETWSKRWHDLGALSFGQQHTDALVNVVEGFTAAEDLSQLRSNEIFIGSPWELREFHLSLNPRQLVVSPTALTPDPLKRNSPELANFVNQNSAAILAGVHVLPQSLIGGSSLMDGQQWLTSAQPPVEESLRHAFANQTCDGCHNSDIPKGHLVDEQNFNLNIDGFYHISPFGDGTGDGKTRLSRFIKEIDLPKRAEIFGTMLTCPAVSPCEVVYRRDHNWGTGSSVTVVVKNVGNVPVTSWDVSFAYTDSTKVSGFWDAVGVDTTAPSYTFRNVSWNGNLNPGESKNFGMGTANGDQIPAISVVCK